MPKKSFVRLRVVSIWVWTAYRHVLGVRFFLLPYRSWDYGIGSVVRLEKLKA